MKLSLILIGFLFSFDIGPSNGFDAKKDGTRRIAQKIKAFFKRHLEKTKNMTKLQEILDQGIIGVKELIQMSYSDEEKYVAKVYEIFIAMKYPLPYSYSRNVKLKHRFVRILIRNAASVSWNKPLEDIVSYVSTAKDWGALLKGLENRFSQWDILKNREIYNVKDITDWGKPGKPQGIDITSANFEAFMKATATLGVEGHKAAGSFTPLVQDGLPILNNLVKLALSSPRFSHPDEDTVTAAGVSVKLSEINIGNKSRVEVAALRIIFVDVNVTLTGKIAQLSLIAPSIVVVPGNKMIVLEGKDGNDYANMKAVSGQFPFVDGLDGLAGNDGYDGGDFLAIANNFMNSKELSVLVEGGNGGPGQNGGDGFDDNYILRLPVKCNIKATELSNMTGWKVSKRGDTYSFDNVGGVGGRGGSGGIGGYGGKEGNIKIIAFQDKDITVQIRKTKGWFGSPGQSGFGGRREGKRQEAGIASMDGKCSWYKIYDKEEITRSNFTAKPARKELVVYKPAFAIVKSYESYFTDIMYHPAISTSTRHFVKTLGEDKQVLGLYSLSRFVDELIRLESTTFAGENRMSLYPPYQAFVRSVEEYLKLTESLDAKHKAILLYMHSVAQSKLSSLHIEPLSVNHAVIDISGYLDCIAEDIEEVEKYQTSLAAQDNRKFSLEHVNKLITIEESLYKEGIDEEIKMANGLIQQRITTVIINMFNYFKDVVAKDINGQIEVYIDYAKQQADYNSRELVEVTLYTIFEAIFVAVKVMMSIIFIPGLFFIPAIIEAIVASTFAKWLYVKHDRFENFREFINVFEDVCGDDMNIPSTTPKYTEPPLYRDEYDSYDYKEPNRPHFRNIQELRNYIIGRNKETEEETKQIIDSFEKNELLQSQQYRDTFARCIVNLNFMKNNLTKSFIIPTLRNITDTILNLNFPSTISSKMSTQLQEEALIVRLKSYIQKSQELTKQLKFKKEFDFLSGLIDIVKTITKINQRKRALRDSKNFAEHIANLKVIRPGDEFLPSNFAQLQLIVSSNIVVDHYSKAIHAFKHFVFPFIGYYLELTRLPTALSSPSLLIETAKTNVRLLKTKLMDYRTSILYDQTVYEMKKFFTSKHHSSKPLFIWANEKHKTSIDILFDGKELKMWAGIDQGLKLNALKIAVPGIYFKAANKSLQEQMNLFMYNFELKLIHEGVNEYRCGNKTYTLNSAPYNFTFSYETDKNGIPLSYNDVYKKQMTGDFVLSPYAVWTLQLFNRTGADLSPYKKAFSGYIDIELEGEARYLDDDFHCHKQLDEEYKKPEKPKAEGLYQPTYEHKSLDNQLRSTSGAKTVSNFIIDVALTLLKYI